MKLSFESFNFSALQPNDVLIVEVPSASDDCVNLARNFVKSLMESGKIPKETFCMFCSRQHPFSLREIQEAMMNANGWFKMKPVPIKEIV